MPDEIEAASNAENAGEGSTYWIFTQNPNVQAFTDLLNRALDKPADHLQVAGSDGGPLVIRWPRADEDESGGLESGSQVDDLPRSTVKQLPDET